MTADVGNGNSGRNIYHLMQILADGELFSFLTSWIRFKELRQLRL